MKTVFAAINAKYVHTNLAVRYMQCLAEQHGGYETEFVEYTINHRILQLMREIYLLKADCIVFSCYIWNIQMVLELCEELKKVSPNCKIVLAGPEVSYDSEQLLEKYPFVDAVIRGEGEPVLIPFLEWVNGVCTAEQVPSLSWRSENGINSTQSAPLPSLDVLPFPYKDLNELGGRILYFEASRGCPFRCGYCLSSIGTGVRFMPLEQVFAAMDIFLANKVRQVKFVDRTFNCNKNYALAIWKYLSEHDNGVTNFHFEIAGELLDDETMDFLKTVRKEQFQFEVGVQSTNNETLAGITRKTHIPSLFEICKKIDSFGNIHQHLDLIAGLPYEDKKSFANSFNDVYALRPQQLQLGFLKVLKGSAIHRQKQEFGIIYTTRAPYEVMATKWLSYDDILSLKQTEDMVERYYNSGRFSNILEQLVPLFATPFDFYEQLGSYFSQQGHHLKNQTKEQLYTILRDFCIEKGLQFTDFMEECCLLDICLHEKPKKLPEFIKNRLNDDYQKQIIEFYDNTENITRYLPEFEGENGKRISRIAHLQVFAYDMASGERKTTAMLFNYEKRGLTGKAESFEIVIGD
ncbi:MAG: B12-binding domain-containing radical SAM protein [Oscillospiraceae bacterium]|nr:B12-binding domain-containing radical SAM protein [Oscillospiraceae bacterium]